MRDDIKINNAGFVNFNSRNWNYKGDKGSWAKIEKDKDGNEKMIVSKAAKGIISDKYNQEMADFCNEFGIDFSGMSCGEKVEISL